MAEIQADISDSSLSNDHIEDSSPSVNPDVSDSNGNGITYEQVRSDVIAGFDLAEDPTKGAIPSVPRENGGIAEHLKGVLGELPAPTPVSNTAEVSKPRLIKTFYMVKYPRADTSEIQAKMAAVDGKIQEKKLTVQRIIASLKEKQASRKELVQNVKEYRTRGKALNEEVTKKYEEIRPLQDRLKELKSANNEAKEVGRSLQFSTSEDLNRRIADINYRMHHESIGLTEEKKLVRELQLLEKSRPAIEAFEAKKVQADQDGHTEGLQSQLQPLLAEVAALKEQRDAEHEIANTFSKDLELVDKELSALRKDLDVANKANNELFSTLQKLRLENYDLEGASRKNRSDLFKARSLARENDVEKLKEVISEQVENFHTLWKDRKFRANYVLWNEHSTLKRFPTADTRRLGVDEDPVPVKPQKPLVPEKTEKKTGKPPVKESKSEVSETAAKPVVKEVPAVKKPQAVKPKVEASPSPPVLEFEEFNVKEAVANLVKEVPPKEDEESLKEKRREEAIAKAKEAEDRKKRQAEKKQARAAAWAAAKEAEEAAKKKEKEKLKKEKKSGSGEEAVEEQAEEQSDEVEGVDNSEDSAPSSQKGKEAVVSDPRKNKQALKKVTKSKVIPKSLIKKGGQNFLSFWVYFAGALGAILVILFAILAASSPAKEASV